MTIFLWVFFINCATEQKAIRTANMVQEKCDAPVWNVGDYWRYRYSDMKEWQYTVERIEEDSYIVDDYYGSYKNCFDKKTLRLVAFIDSKGRKQKVYSAFFGDFPIYVGKNGAKCLVVTSPISTI